MTLRIRATPEAEADINAAYIWYEQAGAGLAERFASAFRDTLLEVAKRPAASRVVHEGLRRALIQRFPYTVFYVQDDRDIVIIGCFHARRDPKAWRIRGREYGE